MSSATLERVSPDGDAARRDAWICAALLVATTIVYLPVARHEFLSFDDPAYVLENTHVRAGFSWKGIAWAFTTRAQSNWHPLTWLSHMLDAQVFGTEGLVLGLPASGWHHLVSLAFHALNGALLYLLLRRATGATWCSALVAGLFAVHPLHVESVAWASERKDVLSTFLGLACLLTYVGYTRNPSRWRYASVLLLLSLGLMSKPMLVTWPVLMFLLDVWPLGRAAAGPGRVPIRRLLIEKLPMAALALASSAATLFAQQSAMHLTSVVPLEMRIENAVVSTAIYAWKAVYPSGLAILYPFPHEIDGGLVLVASLFVVTLTVLAVRSRRSVPWFAFGWAWFLVALLPVLGLVQVGLQARADRYTYVPLVGLFVIAAWGLRALARRSNLMRGVASAVAVAALVGSGLVASAQVRRWRTTETLFRHACEVTNGNGWAHRILADDLISQRRPAEAIDEYRRALAVWPEDPRAHNNLGCAFEAVGRLDAARAEYGVAVRLEPRNEVYRRNLARAGGL